MNTRGDSWYAIVNPAARGARGASGWPLIEQALQRAGVPFEAVRTSAAREATELARQAAVSGRSRLLIAGGDGSVHEAVNGLMESGSHARSRVTLAVAPLGTGNDWSRSLGIDPDPDAVARSLRAGRTLLHDVGRIEFPSAGHGAGRWFINVAGAGIDSAVVERLPASVPSRLTYLRQALRGLLSYDSPGFRIDADGVRLERRLLVAFVANGRYCGNRMLVAPTAQLDDGLLELVAIDRLGLGRVLVKLQKLYRGTILGDPAVHHHRAQRVTMATDRPTPIQADGQIVGHTPAIFSVEPRALRVIVGAKIG